MSEARTRNAGTFHVVCHDCPHERLSNCPDEASELVTEHVATTDHETEFQRIA